MSLGKFVDLVAAAALAEAIDEDLARLTSTAMSYRKNGSVKNLQTFVLPKLLLRWNCVFSDQAVPQIYTRKTYLLLALLLHKYGYKESAITRKALTAIDALNKEVVLSDQFFRKTEEIKKLLNSKPKVLTKRPSVPKSTTFYREKDVIAFKLKNKYYCAYVHEITGAHASPVLEFYDGVFDSIPAMDRLTRQKARGKNYNDNIRRIHTVSVSGMKSNPDPANQFFLIKSNVAQKPRNTNLVQPDWLYSIEDIFQLQKTVESIFKN